MALIKLFHLLYSRILLEMCIDLSCLKLAKIIVPTSHWTRSWKWLIKPMAILPYVTYLDLSSSIYHLAATPVRVHWNNRNWIESSFNELDNHHK
jgi:hypothetical protein